MGLQVTFLLNNDFPITPKIPQTLNEIVTFRKGYVRIGNENGINIIITYDGHIMEFNNGELLLDKSLL